VTEQPCREDRLNLTVALAVKNKTHPNRNNFVAFVRKVYATKFGLTERQTREDLEILIKAYHAERWQTLLANCPYPLSEEEVNSWMA
jgi:hypothetical protein